MTTWEVPATVVRVIDGDTIVVDLDLGWRVYRNAEHVRIAGINAPERGTPEGDAATGYARALLNVGDAVRVVSSAKPSFERTVGSIKMLEGVYLGRDFGEVMVAAGHAKDVQPT